jgi:DNA invertase Pin-like site-specific DNA recombinase
MNVAIYMRLSKEDEFCHDESNSIFMQRIMLRDYVREHFPDAKVKEFVDDGYSGTDFERPGVQELLEKVRNDEIDCIIVKDLSRFGRDYIELGSYLEQIFPFMGVRFISINDKYDSASVFGNVADIDVNFKNLLYDLYSKDLSVKIKASVKAMKEQGNFLGAKPPFGYAKSPDDRHKLIIAEDEAEVVRRMFTMYADGLSGNEIAKVFNSEGVRTPAQFRQEKGFKPKGDIYLWQSASMYRMLRNRTYLGDLVQGTYTNERLHVSKRVNDPEKWIITKNHHEAIIDKELFDRVQERLEHKKCLRKKKDMYLLVGRVKCGCCGRNLRHVGKEPGQPHFWCYGLNVNNLDGCVKRIDDFYLEEVIMLRLQQHIMELGESDRLLQEEKDTALEKVEAMRRECDAAERAIEAEKKRRMADFEDYALGKKGGYDGATTQIEVLRRKYEEARERLSEAEGKAAEYDRVKVHESFAVMKLTPELLDEYVESIEVYQGDEVRIMWK